MHREREKRVHKHVAEDRVQLQYMEVGRTGPGAINDLTSGPLKGIFQWGCWNFKQHACDTQTHVHTHIIIIIMYPHFLHSSSS